MFANKFTEPVPDDPVSIKYWTLLCLIMSWVIVYLILMKVRINKT